MMGVSGVSAPERLIGQLRVSFDGQKSAAMAFMT